MNTLTDLSNTLSGETAHPDAAPFFIRGHVVEGADSIQRSRDLGVSFATPELDLNSLVHPRTELPPLLNTPLAEIIDFLVESGQRLCDPNNEHVQACIDRMAKVSLAQRKVIEHQMLHATDYLNKKLLTEVVEQNFPNPRALDEWVPRTDHQGRRSFIRAYARTCRLLCSAHEWPYRRWPAHSASGQRRVNGEQMPTLSAKPSSIGYGVKRTRAFTMWHQTVTLSGSARLPIFGCWANTS